MRRRAVVTSRGLLRGDLGVTAIVRHDDALYEGVAHHVHLGEMAEGNALDAIEELRASANPLRCPCGRSTWVTSPVTTEREE